MKRTGPIASSTVAPNIHRNSMLTASWTIDAWMNIDVKTVETEIALGTPPYLMSSAALGPPMIPPPWPIVTR